MEIRGDAGAFLAGPLPGERHGMAGGLVLVSGHAGPRAGDRLRRGLVVIEGNAGDWVGSRMIAGTVVVCGMAGRLPGYLLRRGTLVLGGAAALSPTFVATRGETTVFTALLARALAPVSVAAATLAARPCERLAGDMATGGLGEIFLSL